ncbi:MAG: hypothetical protein M1296_07245 [Chloroflexi bacterium]|nr:hypothetical protein [Chloroflexota bacterium]
MKNDGRDDTRIFAVALGIFIVALPVIFQIARAFPRSPWTPLLGAMPLVPAAVALFAVVRFVRLLTEQQRRVLLESLIFGFGATAFLSISIGFLQNAGLPLFSWVWVLPLMAILWLLGLFLASRSSF